jgi:hypothetical protein
VKFGEQNAHDCLRCGESPRILVLEQPDRYVGLVLGENTSPAIVASAVTQVLKESAES